MKSKLTPLVLRRILLSILSISILISGVIYYFGYQKLSQKGVQVNKAVIDARSSEDNITRMIDLERRMKDYDEISEIAGSMIAPLSSFGYQEKTISTINSYAKQAGVVVSQIDFNPKTKEKTSTTGVSNTLATVTLANPTDYYNFLKFMKFIEGGLSQMQITQVSIQKTTSGNNDVSVGALTIAIYVE